MAIGRITRAPCVSPCRADGQPHACAGRCRRRPARAGEGSPVLTPHDLWLPSCPSPSTLAPDLPFTPNRSRSGEAWPPVAGGPLAPQNPRTSRECVGPSATAAGTPARTFGHHECGPASSSGSGPCRCRCRLERRSSCHVPSPGPSPGRLPSKGFLCSRLPVPSK